jgi:aspartyl-tRNA(Asn)/glutamyl-tRNA(Gln) amidotransferase subunit C
VALHADDVDALARLAALAVGDEERTQLARHLGDIVDEIGVLTAVDIDGIAPWQPPMPTCAPLRADIAAPPFPVDEIMGGAPASDGGLVIVPRFVEPAG